MHTTEATLRSAFVLTRYLHVLLKRHRQNAKLSDFLCRFKICPSKMIAGWPFFVDFHIFVHSTDRFAFFIELTAPIAGPFFEQLLFSKTVVR